MKHSILTLLLCTSLTASYGSTTTPYTSIEVTFREMLKNKAVAIKWFKLSREQQGEVKSMIVEAENRARSITSGTTLTLETCCALFFGKIAEFENSKTIPKAPIYVR